MNPHDTKDPRIEPIIRDSSMRVALGITQGALRKRIKSGTLPDYDVKLSRRARGWRESTLAKVGIVVMGVAPGSGA